jgi:transketolase
VRNVLCAALVEQAARPDFVFLTGDLGYNALEPLRAAMGERFINAGVAEQNMVSVAAGLSASRLNAWTYSIASFLYTRPFEQIRNDVCLHDLPVKIVGNGGGYAYGVMGATHHALEDYGALLCLRGMSAFVPAFAADVPPIIHKLFAHAGPAYLRLGRDEKPKNFELPAYAPWRRLLSGGGDTLVIVGPMAGPVWEAAAALEEARRPNLWILTELPVTPASIPAEFLEDLRRSRALVVAEEHVAQGGVGQALTHALALMGKLPKSFAHRHALGYVTGRYGSQLYHRKECGLDPAGVLGAL